MKKSVEIKAVEQLSNAVADVRFEDSLFAMELHKQPVKVQRRVMKLFLTICKFWAIDWKFDNNTNKDEQVLLLSESINATHGDNIEKILDECQTPMVKYYNDNEGVVNLDEYHTR